MSSSRPSPESDNLYLEKCDRCILSLLQPHLKCIDETSFEFGQIQQILTQFRESLEQNAIIRLTLHGQVKCITQRAEQLLGQYFGVQDVSLLPDPLQRWFKHHTSQLISDAPSHGLPLSLERAGKQLIIRPIPDADSKHYLLLLEEQDLPSLSVDALELLGLTRREAEVLFWMAKDKSNMGIARVLGCCEGTVRKHLENLYKKLEVQTRMGAVMTALKRLGLLSTSL